MKHQVNVYYVYCPRSLCPVESYRKYQQKLAEEILDYGLKNMFSIEGTEKIIAKGRYGKPYLKGMEQYQYNISNTEGMVVCALSDVCIGVDVERKKPFRSGILRKCATLDETAYIMETEEEGIQEERFFQLWTLKESYIKMTGEGMRTPLQEVAFIFAEDGGISCSKKGKFYQRQQREYWISLCAEEEVEVNWYQLEG